MKYQQHVQNLNIVELEIPRMALTSGTSPVNYLKAFNIILFLTSDEKDVEDALRLGEEIFIWIYCLHLLLRLFWHHKRMWNDIKIMTYR